MSPTALHEHPKIQLYILEGQCYGHGAYSVAGARGNGLSSIWGTSLWEGELLLYCII